MDNIQKQEDRIQQECYMWFHNTYPHLRGLLCYNLNNSASAIQGNKNKSMGLQPGRSDLVLYYAGHAYMIEMKTEYGKQSRGQSEWQSLTTRHGFVYAVIRTLDEFKVFIQRIAL